MERIITKGGETLNAITYEKASQAMEQVPDKVDELSCNQLIRNLLRTNLKLLKLNEISTILLF
jgi:hypothetical protein